MKCIRCIPKLNNDQPQQLLDLYLVLLTAIALGGKIADSMHPALRAAAKAMDP